MGSDNEPDHNYLNKGRIHHGTSLKLPSLAPSPPPPFSLQCSLSLSLSLARWVSLPLPTPVSHTVNPMEAVALPFSVFFLPNRFSVGTQLNYTH